MPANSRSSNTVSVCKPGALVATDQYRSYKSSCIDVVGRNAKDALYGPLSVIFVLVHLYMYVNFKAYPQDGLAKKK